jgi:hypothetical protein
VESLADSFNTGLYKRRMENLVWLMKKAIVVVARVEERNP